MQNVQMALEESGRKRVRWMQMVLGRIMWREKYL